MIGPFELNWFVQQLFAAYGEKHINFCVARQHIIWRVRYLYVHMPDNNKTIVRGPSHVYAVISPSFRSSGWRERLTEMTYEQRMLHNSKARSYEIYQKV